MTLPQQFPRELALLRLDDVLPELAPGPRTAYQALFDARHQDPLAQQGLLLVGPGGLRPLMALMRLLVLRLRELNLQAYEAEGARPNYRTAYVQGARLTLPLPELAHALFLERADAAPPDTAAALVNFPAPLFATWEGPATGPVWAALCQRCDIIRLES